VVRLEETRANTKLWRGNIHLENREEEGKTLRRILRGEVVKMEDGWKWLRVMSNGGLRY
jgi:hypothetical protein